MPYALLSHLLLVSLVIPFFYFLFLMIGKCLGNHLTSRARYHLWFVFLFVLAVPFLQVLQAGTKLQNYSRNLLGPLFSQTKVSLPEKAYETAASGSSLAYCRYIMLPYSSFTRQFYLCNSSLILINFLIYNLP